jgi:hypothetical protein
LKLDNGPFYSDSALAKDRTNIRLNTIRNHPLLLSYIIHLTYLSHYVPLGTIIAFKVFPSANAIIFWTA